MFKKESHSSKVKETKKEPVVAYYSLTLDVHVQHWFFPLSMRCDILSVYLRLFAIRWVYFDLIKTVQPKNSFTPANQPPPPPPTTTNKEEKNGKNIYRNWNVLCKKRRKYFTLLYFASTFYLIFFIYFFRFVPHSFASCIVVCIVCCLRSMQIQRAIRWIRCSSVHN